MTFESLIAQGIRDTMEEKMAEYRVDGKTHRFSLAYRIRRRCILRSRNNITPLSIRKIRLILIAVILALFALTGFSLWRQLGGFSFNIFNDHSIVHYSDNNAKTTIEEIYCLPEEYELLSFSSNKTNILSEYMIDGEIVTISQHLIPFEYNANTENNNAEYLKINENDGYYITVDGETYISWAMDSYRFYISGKIDKNSAISLAESLKIGNFDQIP